MPAVRICLISFPWASDNPKRFVDELLKIFQKITSEIVAIGGPPSSSSLDCLPTIRYVDIGARMHFIPHKSPLMYSVLLWILKWLLIQARTCRAIGQYCRDSDVAVFYMAYPHHLLPLITAKITGVKTMEIITRGRPSSTLSRLLAIQDHIMFRLLDGISPESEDLTSHNCLKPSHARILPEGARYVDSSIVRPFVAFEDREKAVGYVGRLHREKGILEFLEAIPMIHSVDNTTRFFIIGNGNLEDWVAAESQRLREDYGIDITVTGGVEWTRIPEMISRLRLLVLPSASEGLPTVIIEAMACETPVLSTRVGAIPSIIKDGETGFIMPDNSPDSIARHVLRAIAHENLRDIAVNGRTLVRNRYDFDSAVSRYRLIIQDIEREVD